MDKIHPLYNFISFRKPNRIELRKNALNATVKKKRKGLNITNYSSC